MRITDHNPKRVVAALAIIMTICFGSLVRQANARAQAQAEAQRRTTTTTPTRQASGATKSATPQDGYHRPDPTHPFTPQIPGSNRHRPDKVFLENADSIIKTAGSGMDADRQLVKGNVKFRQMGMWMFCDSAYYFPDLNSMDAFGHVRMEQGDTLFVYADKLFYNGTDRYAKLRQGATEPVVRLINRNVKLTTDSLDYDLAQDIGWYAHGGRLEDDVNTLTSIYGEFSPSTNNAIFYHDVELHGSQNHFHMFTDTLYYNTDTHIARVETPTRIKSTKDDIQTTEGFYNTNTGVAELMSRSTIFHTDSLNRTTTLEGDSIVYDPTTRISRAYSFRNPAKHPQPMVITDTARKVTLIGGFGIYNDSTREAMATEYPLLLEYSQTDTLFLRADTIRSWLIERVVARDTLPATPPELPVAESDTTVDTDDIDLTLPFRSQWQYGAGPDSLHLDFPDLAELDALLQPQPAEILPAEDVAAESVVAESVVADSVAAHLPVPPAAPQAQQDSVWHKAMAYPRARFFRKDMQGIADTITFTEIDSLLRMTRLPIVWAEERQVRGDTIVVHFNDSTADYARIPTNAMMMEHVEEDYYNQLHSDKMLLLFSDGALRRLEAEGSVQTIMLPMEQDSTYNRLVDAESSYLTVDIEDDQLQRLKMWPEVTGNVTPLFMVKRSQKLLPKAQWLDMLRPKREWYGDEADMVKWDDDLGELTPELEQYFETGVVSGPTP